MILNELGWQVSRSFAFVSGVQSLREVGKQKCMLAYICDWKLLHLRLEASLGRCVKKMQISNSSWRFSLSCIEKMHILNSTCRFSTCRFSTRCVGKMQIFNQLVDSRLVVSKKCRFSIQLVERICVAYLAI